MTKAQPADGVLMARPPKATFSDHLRDDVIVVRVIGEIDFADTDHIADSLDAAIMLADRLVVVDLSGLSFLDVAATRALRLGRIRAFQAGVSVVLAAPTPSVAHLLSRTDPGCSLPLYDTVSRAIRSDGRRLVRRGPIRLHIVSSAPA